jgi:hypothetical protein
METDWFPDSVAFHDVRWRMWVLTSLAAHCRQLPGSFAEFGVYRAGCAFMLLATTEDAPAPDLFLFDTFSGIPGGQSDEGRDGGTDSRECGQIHRSTMSGAA